jgi:DNA (cytosine-5)-methyltransferase 1/putative restriction endonuclease
MHSRNPGIIALAEKIGRTPSAVAMKLVNFASLDPAIVASGRTGLGNASAMDKIVWGTFQQNWEQELLSAASQLEPATVSVVEEGETSRRAEVEIRTKQSLFRRMVLSSYAGRCCMSGLSETRLLVASHIVPWGESRDHRLNPRNGLCLSVLHDKAFDRGLITVSPDLTVRVSSVISMLRDDSFVQSTLVVMDGRKINLPEKFSPAPEFLEWHNQYVFVD